MAQYEFSASALIPAPAAQVYAILADYRQTHPRILPKPPFVSLDVEQGGVGEGTVFQCQMRLLGRIQTFRAAVTEPTPGRTLMETVEGTGMVTTFSVEPKSKGQAAQATIRTDMKVREGLLGKLEGWITTRLLQPVYVRELEQLAAFATNQTGVK